MKKKKKKTWKIEWDGMARTGMNWNENDACNLKEYGKEELKDAKTKEIK